MLGILPVMLRSTTADSVVTVLSLAPPGAAVSLFCLALCKAVLLNTSCTPP